MSDVPSTSSSPAARPPRDGITYAILVATLLIILAIGVAGYVLRAEMLRLKEAKPEAPPEVTRALSELRSSLTEQRAESATRIDELKRELAAMKEEQATQSSPDIRALQEKLDAIAARLEKNDAAAQSSAQDQTPMDATEQPADTANPAADAASTTLEDYLTLYQAVRSGKPYTTQLATLVPQLNGLDPDALTDLQDHAETGIPTEDALADEWRKITVEQADQGHDGDAENDTGLPGWMQALNHRLGGLVKIRRTGEAAQSDAEDITSLSDMEAMVKTLPDDATGPYAEWLDKIEARRNVLDALRMVESSLSRGA